MGWSLPYTLGVLNRWKMAPTYCRAVLPHDQRIALDGTPAEPVDAEAKELAKRAFYCRHEAALAPQSEQVSVESFSLTTGIYGQAQRRRRWPLPR